MQNRKMKKVVAIMMVAATIGIVSGCGKKAEKSEVTTTVTDTDTQESDVTVNEAAIDQVFNHIEVNGVHVDFPFSLNDLGDDYDFANYVDMGDGTFGMDLQYRGQKIANVYVIAEKIDEVDRDSKMIDVHIYVYESDEQMIKINGIDCNSSIEEMTNNLCEMYKYYNDDSSILLLEYTDKDYYASVSVSEGKKIETIFLNKKIN